MKVHPFFFAFTSPLIASVKTERDRRVLLRAGFLCFALSVSACDRNETDSSNEDRTSVTNGKTSRPPGRHSPELVKDLFLSEQRQREMLNEKRLDSVRELSASALMATIRSLNPIDERNDRVILPNLFLALAEKDPSRTLELLDEVPDPYYRIGALAVFPYLAEIHPEILQDFVLATDFSAERNRWMMLEACAALGKKNPEKALSFFEEMPNEIKQGHLGTILLKQAASEEPRLVIDFLVNKKQSPYFTGLFRDVLYTILVNDPILALTLASSHPEVQDTHLTAGIYTSIVRKDSKLALERIPDTSPEVREEILTRRGFDNMTYFTRLFSEDPAKTLGLLNGIVPTPANANLFKEAVDQLSSLPAGPVRHSSVRSFAEAIRPVDPVTADRWIESLR
jgi:hypothetical protein